MMKVVAVVLLLVAVALAGNYNPCSSPVEASWCDCSPDNSDITVVSASFSPNPVVKGQKVTGSVSTLDASTYSITSGSVKVLVKFGIIPLIDKTYDLCTLLSEAHASDPSIQECPIAPYTVKKISFSEAIPDTFPSGTYKGSLTVTDQKGASVQCIQFDMDIKDGQASGEIPLIQ